jgi:hypothetical protein
MLTRPIHGRFTRLTLTYNGKTFHMRLTTFGSVAGTWVWM